MNEPSEAYYRALEATQLLHASTKKFNGRFLWRYLSGLVPLVAKVRPRTLLDYGCGKGVQWSKPIDNGRLLGDHLGVKVTMFDPGWPQYAAEPRGKFDIVVCTQVLGSIPIADLPWVINRLYSFADKAVFVGERIRDRPIRKKHLAHMVEEMPHGWTREQWIAALRSVEIPAGLTVVLQTGHDIEVIQ